MLDEAQAGIKIAGKNIKNLRYADDTTLMAESEEELKSLLMKVKEESGKAGLKLNIQKTKTTFSKAIILQLKTSNYFKKTLNIHKTKIMASGSITSWQIDGETVEPVTDFIFLGSKILQMVTAAWNSDTYSLEEKLWPP